MKILGRRRRAKHFLFHVHNSNYNAGRLFKFQVQMFHRGHLVWTARGSPAHSGRFLALLQALEQAAIEGAPHNFSLQKAFFILCHFVQQLPFEVGCSPA